jgi:hypothetical protein
MKRTPQQMPRLNIGKLLNKYDHLSNFDRSKIRLSIVFLSIGVSIGFVYWLVQPVFHFNTPRNVYVTILPIVIITLLLIRTGVNYMLVGNWIVFCFFLPTSFSIFFSGGITSVVLPWLAIMPVLASLLLTKSQSFVWLGISVATIVMLIVFQSMVPPVLYSGGPWRGLLSTSGLTIILFFCTTLFDKSILRLLGELKASNDDLYAGKMEIAMRNETLERYWQTLLDLSKSEFIQSREWHSSLDHIVRVAMKELKVSRASVWIYHESGMIDCVAFSGRSGDKSPLYEKLAYASNPAYFNAIKNEWVIAADDVFTNAETKGFATNYLAQYNIKSMLDVPFYFENTIGGILCVENQETFRPWTPEDIIFAISLGEIISLSHKASLRREYEQKISEQNLELTMQRDEINQLNQSLEERFLARTEELFQKNRQLAEYIFINSHLLRGPLARLLGLIDLVQKDNELSLGKHADYLTKMKTSGEELDTVVRKINDALSGGIDLDRNTIKP